MTTTGQHGEEGYVDLLADLRLSTDLSYALRTKNFPRYRGAYALTAGRTPLQIMEECLASVRVQSAIDCVSSERGWSREATEKAARSIATEMAQCFDMKTVRPLAYLAKKVIPQLFSHVYVNRGRFMQLKELSEKSAIIFMPSHRTYMDFILLQFLCFHYEINLPAIAAAVDFLNMKFMGEALRRCGAFFIRRHFGDDKLYWSIFSEYVENQLKHADRPMEFFIEGTRSRTGKSLHPKYGLLSVLLEPYFRNEIFDFHLVPVSVSFSRILEESLYAYELLGFPKPKESTSGLWKARTVLNTDFGDVYVHAGEPISVRDYFSRLERPLSTRISTSDAISTFTNFSNIAPFEQAINRSVHSLKPLVLFEYTTPEQVEIRRLGHLVVKINEEHAVVRLWSLACIVLSGMLRKAGTSFQRIEIPYSEFLRNVEWIFDLSQRLRYNIPLRMGTVNDDIQYYLKLHSNIVEKDAEVLTLKPVNVSVVNTASGKMSGKLIDSAVPRLVISNYANQAMHLFADLSFVCLAILKNNGQTDRDVVFRDFRFLQELFSREFVSIPGEEVKAFDCAMTRLLAAMIEEPASGMSNASYRIKEPSNRRFSTVYKLSCITESFLRGYFLYCDILLGLRKHAEGFNEKFVVDQVQTSISRMLQDGVVSNFELLSADMIKNCLHALAAMNAVQKHHTESTKFMIIDGALSAVRTRLWPFVAALDAVGKDSIVINEFMDITKSKL